MSRNLRITIIILGLLILCCALVVLGYAAWPAETLRAQATLAPTVFISP